jgi:hypothetical protein
VGAVTIDEMQKLFGHLPSINWARAKAEDVQVKTHVLTSVGEFPGISMIVTTGGAVNEGGKAISLHDVPKHLHEFGPEWRVTLLHLAHEFERAKKRVVFTVPAWQYGGNVLLLDGLHRAGALTLARGVEFGLEIHALRMKEMWGVRDWFRRQP